MDEEVREKLLYILVGCSGAGKSTWCATHLSRPTRKVSRDAVRKQLTGDVSNQSENAAVEAIVRNQVYTFLQAGEDVAIDCTNLNGPRDVKYWMEIAQRADDMDESGAVTRPIIVVFYDSLKPELCAARVAHDLERGVDRSRTTDVDGLIEKMSMRFRKQLPSIIKYANENRIEIIRVGE